MKYKYTCWNDTTIPLTIGVEDVSGKYTCEVTWISKDDGSRQEVKGPTTTSFRDAVSRCVAIIMYGFGPYRATLDEAAVRNLYDLHGSKDLVTLYQRLGELILKKGRCITSIQAYMQ